MSQVDLSQLKKFPVPWSEINQKFDNQAEFDRFLSIGNSEISIDDVEPIDIEKRFQDLQ